MNVKNSIAKSTVSLFAITLFIKALGFIKQAVLAAVYGANAATDALYMSSSIINALCTVVFSALSISLLSMYAEKLIDKGQASANTLINNTLRLFLPIAVFLTALFFFGAPLFARIFAPSYAGEQLQDLTMDIRVMSISFVCACYYLTLNVVAEANKHFVPGKCYALFQNLFVVIAALLLPSSHDANSLVYAFALAGVVQCILITLSVRDNYHPSLRGRAEDGEMLLLLRMVLPLLVGNAIYEINDIVDKQIASGLDSGMVSIMTYGASINEIVTTVIITSVSTVLFSHFATWAAKNNTKEIEYHLRTSLEYIAILTLPIMILCVVCGDHIVAVLYGRGSFGQEDISATYGVVAGYGVGFWFQAARANLVKVYYAFQDSKTPMINGAISVGINILLSIFLAKFIGVAGIAVATSISMLIVTVLLLIQVRKYIPGFSLMQDALEYGKGILSAGCAAGLIMLEKDVLNTSVYISMIAEVVTCIFVYVSILLLTKSRSTYKMRKIFRQHMGSRHD